MKKALFLGIAGSFFFAFTFILNRSMNLEYGGFRPVLRAFDTGVGLWGILADSGILADDHCGRGAFDSAFP